jgi:hypothetical protein
MMTVGLQLLGYKIEYFPNLRVRHFKARLTIFNFIQKFFNKGFIAGKMEKKYKARSEIISFFKDYIPSDNSSLSLNIKMFASKFVYKGIGIWMQVIFFLALKKIFYSIGKLYGRWINI